MPYGKPVDFHGVRLTALPAGHCLGSAMLHVADEEGQTLLYTGDFKLRPSLTAAPADPPRADLLVMETTFGSPTYRLPPREQVVEQLLTLIHEAFSRGRTPVIHAYALGKSQEVTAILTRAGVPVLQHPAIYELSRVYQQCGAELSAPGADVGAYGGRPLAGYAVVTLPRSMPGFRMAGLGDVTSIAVTGWAMNPKTRFRLKVDHALPLSDHADFDELVELVRRVQPQRIATTHGPPGFDEHLRSLGYDAAPLAPSSQRRLF